MIRLNLFAFIIILLVGLLSCRKINRVERKIGGTWVLEEMRVIDGQGFTYYVDNVEGDLILNFDEGTSNGSAIFQNDNINNGMPLVNNFSGDSLELDLEMDVIYIGDNQERRSFSLILYNSYDLVVEYYDFSNYQLRKFIFARN